MRSKIIACWLALAFAAGADLFAGEGNRLAYLEGGGPYYPSIEFPKLITPQWVGEEGVEAVITLGIDDMRDTATYETYLRPILERLKKIDGRAPLSIMTCEIKPDDPRLQSWLQEGLSIETHTIDHPCPILHGGDLSLGKSTYDRCVDLISSIPGNRPVGFRTPCADSQNSLSPRFFPEIFNQLTPNGNFLTLDTSVALLISPNDPALPRDLVHDDEGSGRFEKYLPYEGSFVNWIENYPYPYVIGRLCWEFAWTAPSDWEGLYLQGGSNPITYRDLKAAIDAVVIKQGTHNQVFHPHAGDGVYWSDPKQVIELIDHAVENYGTKIKFLNFREAQERINRNLLVGNPLRAANGQDNGVRLIDLDNDGYLDVVIGNEKTRLTRIWSNATRKWLEVDFPIALVEVRPDGSRSDAGVKFGVGPRADAPTTMILRSDSASGVWHFSGNQWIEDHAMLAGLEIDGNPVMTRHAGRDRGVRLRDLDGDGRCELIVGNDREQAIFAWNEGARKWNRLPFTLPPGVMIAGADGRDRGLRFVDLDGDGHDDVIFSNERSYSVYLWDSMRTGWSKKVMEGKAGDASALPMIAKNGVDNGVWFHSRHLWAQNEDTAEMPNQVDRRAFKDILAQAPIPPRSPKESLRMLQPRPGMRVELVAAEPLVADPVAFAWGPDGKLWVAEMADYPTGVKGKPNGAGRIKWLEDLDGDGRYDRSTLFLDEVHFPTGILPWRGGVLVTAAPRIFFAKDTDGDGRADQQETLYEGFGLGNRQHLVNGPRWGLDNWIYYANGDSGGLIRTVRTGRTVNISGRDFRIRPDEDLLDVQMGQTQFGRNRNDWGDWFGCGNSNPLWHFVLADHYIRRNPHAAAPTPRVDVSVQPGPSQVYPISITRGRYNDPEMANHFTSANSAIIYRDDLLGPQFAGNSFVSEPVHNLIHREVVSPKGMTFTSHRARDESHGEFLASSDKWFRPTMIRTGPDGALWIADMVRKEIEHPEYILDEVARTLDLRAGENMGRIYRVYPVDRRPRPIPRLDRLSTGELVALLESPNGTLRDMVQQRLVHLRDSAAVDPLRELALEGQRPTARLHALCALDGLGALEPDLLAQALQDPHPGVRRHAIRLSEPFLNRAPGLGPLLEKLADSTDAREQLQLAYSLGEWNDARAGRLLAKMALDHRNEPFITAAVLSSVNQANVGLMLARVIETDRATHQDLVETLLGLAIAFDSGSALARILENLTTIQNQGLDPGKAAALAAVFDALDRKDISFADFAARNGPGMQAIVPRLPDIFLLARQTAADPETGEDQRIQAMRLMGREPEGRDGDAQALAGLLKPQTPSSIEQAAIDALLRIGGDSIPELLLAGWNGYLPEVRRRVLDAIFSRAAWFPALIEAIESNPSIASEIDVARRRRLLDDPDPSVRQRAETLLTASIDPDRQNVIEKFQPALTLAGDPSIGQILFTDRCAKCHIAGAEGRRVGPDLAQVAHQTLPSLMTSILDPNRAFESKFVNYIAETNQGLTYAGVLASETSNSIAILDAEGKQKVILRNELASLRGSSLSIMPEGLEDNLTIQQMADLLAFVSQSGPPAKHFEGNQPQLVRPDAPDGPIDLLASNCAIHGGTLVFESPYQNLGFWSSADDRAVWSFEITRAGDYDVWIDYACPDSIAGEAFRLETFHGSITGEVESTGSWDRYRQLKIGAIALPAGIQQLAFQSAGPLSSYLLDLKGIRLEPSAKP